MAAFDPGTLDRWRALAIVDRDGTTVGTISEFYLDRETGHPTWALVNTGLFGATQTFVPLVHATEISDGLQVPYLKSHIKDTPNVDLHDELSPAEEAELFAHYGVEYQPSPEAATAAADNSAEGPGPVPDTAEGADGTPGTAGGLGAVPGSTEGPGAVPGTAGPANRSGVPTTSPSTGEGPGPVPAEPGLAAPATTSDAGPAPAPTPGPGPGPAAPGSDDPIGTQHGPASDTASTAVPDEPGTAVPNGPGATEFLETPRIESQKSGSQRLDTAETQPPEGGSGVEESQGWGGSGVEEHEGRPDRSQDKFLDLNDDTESTSHFSNHDLAWSTPPDPGVARTAPVEPGLPGSTAASPYGAGPTTVDKGGPSVASAGAPPTVPEEPGWPPGAAGGFEEDEPLDQPTGASDRWREAKLAAERDRIARAATAQPEDRSPLERARRRLERLVGGGQDHPDPDEISPGDQEAAERARRARLGLDEDDHDRR